MGVNPAALGKLVSLFEREVGQGTLPSGQIALARRGELIAFETAGDANSETLYLTFSTTKAVTSSAVWILLQEGRVRLEEKVADVIPGFDENGKGDVLVEHLLTHTAGFPNAPFELAEMDDPERRVARFASWRLDWEPGTRFQYHPRSSMWVLAEVIRRRGGLDYREFVRERVMRPLGLDDYHLGLPAELDARVPQLLRVGDAPSAEALESAGIRIPREMSSVGLDVERFNQALFRRVGEPGGGGITSAAELALFYQALLGHGSESVWKPDTLEAARIIRTGDFTDPMTGQTACRGLGLVIAGDESRVFRGFPPQCSPRAFGHPGAGVQIAWADPDSQLSFSFLTNGIDRDMLRMGRVGLTLSMRAAASINEVE
jgi:CubicO group peptidase (beta-lactamase class C family)